MLMECGSPQTGQKRTQRGPLLSKAESASVAGRCCVILSWIHPVRDRPDFLCEPRQVRVGSFERQLREPEPLHTQELLLVIVDRDGAVPAQCVPQAHIRMA